LRRNCELLSYINRRKQTYYLHQGQTKTGKPKYFFSLKKEGTLLDIIPEGYEVYENPNAQVFLRQIKPKLITEQEKIIVEKGVKKYSQVKHFLIDIKDKIISIYLPDDDGNYLSEILKTQPQQKIKEAQETLLLHTHYSPMMQFILVDKEKRLFLAQRYCFRGSVDDWIDISSTDQLENLVKQYVKHLGQDSYYELFYF
jgi:hypothetical protein